MLLITLPTGSPRTQLGALCGVGLSLANARALSAMGRFATQRAAGKPKLVLGILLGMFQVKLLLLGLAIYLMMHFLPVSLPWLVAGLSLLPVAALLRGVEHAYREVTETGASDAPDSADGALARAPTSDDRDAALRAKQAG